MSPSSESVFRIEGRVVDAATRKGIPDLRIEAWASGLPEDRLVGSATSGAQGRFAIAVTGTQLGDMADGQRPPVFFKVLLGTELIADTEASVTWSARSRATLVEVPVTLSVSTGTGSPRPTAERDGVVTVSGRVTSVDQPGTGDLRVVITDVGVGQSARLAETVTDDRGRYSVSLAANRSGGNRTAGLDLQVMVYAGQRKLAASGIRYDAKWDEVIDVELPEGIVGLPTEWETLTSNVSSHVRGRLGEIEESDERQDITFLANKTGWDARAVAMAVLADQFSQGSGDTIAPPLYYALFRAGVAANAEAVSRVSGARAQAIWKAASAQRIIPAVSPEQAAIAARTFDGQALRAMLTVPPIPGGSTLEEILTVSRLDAQQQRGVVELYATHRDDLPTFWRKAVDQLGDAPTRRLQFDARLAQLTTNNAPLIRAVHQAQGPNPIEDTTSLAHRGYYRTERWQELLTAEISIPNHVPGADAAERRKNYARLLARQVRIAHPTAAIADQVKRSDLKVDARDGVHEFLTTHRGYEIGVTPVQQFATRNGIDIAPQVLAQVKRLERVYQLTPGDSAMAGLLESGYDAATNIARLERRDFIERVSGRVGGSAVAAQIHDRSVQIHNAVLNITIAYVSGRNGVAIGQRSAKELGTGTDGSGGMIPALAPGSAAVSATATLEQLFGEMDYCACDHCRSILSPAAYLVDLLHLLDGTPGPDGRTPLQVLLSRRPDLEHLPLTCENTNTVLPYIDIVNETLESFVAHGATLGAFQDYQGHDTAGVASADLLAQPQYVVPMAYETLRHARFPLPLPFDQPLERTRRFFKTLGVPLPEAMEQLRTGDLLESEGTGYAWRDILLEELQISPSEREVLTDAVAVPLAAMYGFADGTSDTDAIAALSNARDVSRRLGITYDEVVALLRTRFINPHAGLIPKLDRLGVPIATLVALNAGTLSDVDFDALLPRGVLAPDPGAYGGDIKAWIRSEAIFSRVMRIVTLTDPSGDETSGDFASLEFRYARPMTSADDTSTRLDAVAYVRLLRFVRIWRKLGWTIELTDATLSALLGTGDAEIGTTGELDIAMSRCLDQLGAFVRVARALELSSDADLRSLLVLWAPIDTHVGGLYERLFLVAGPATRDPVFADDGYGRFLVDGSQKLVGHAESLRSACGLTGDEFAQTLQALGFGLDTVTVPYVHGSPTLDAGIRDTDARVRYDHAAGQLSYTGALTTAARDALYGAPGVTPALQDAIGMLFEKCQVTLTPLTLDTVSAVYRLGWLARKLAISVRELQALLQVTGLNPFTPPDPADPAVMRIVRLLRALRGAGVTLASALRLLWNHDLTGRRSDTGAHVYALVRALRSDFLAIDAQLRTSADTDGTVSRAAMTTVFGGSIATEFFALADNTIVLQTPYTHASSRLPEPLTSVAAALSYDPFRHTLAYAGLLDGERADALRTACDASPSDDATDELKRAIETLAAQGDAARSALFARSAALQALFEAYTGSTESVEARRAALLDSLRPELSLRRKRLQAVQRLSATARIDLDVAQALLGGVEEPFALHAVDDRGQSALVDALAIERCGLAAQFYFRSTATGVPDRSVAADPTLRYGASDHPLPVGSEPGAAISCRWMGRIEAPRTDHYNFEVEADEDASIVLRVGAHVVPLAPRGGRMRNVQPLELVAGSLYDFELTVERVRDTVAVRWETPSSALEIIPAEHLYAPTSFGAIAALCDRLVRAGALAQSLGLAPSELAWFATHEDYLVAGAGWLNALPVASNPDLTATVELTDVLEDLLAYVRVKSDLSISGDSLLQCLATPDEVAELPAASALALLRCDPRSLRDVLAHLGLETGALRHVRSFCRVYDVLAVARTTGLRVGALIAATTNHPSAQVAGALESAVKARHDAADWRSVVQPINDQLRALQRTALVSHVLHRLRADAATAHIDTPEKLFEFFLMDVQMEPCMQTSRVRHALSSVQLFIERCLMNLEPEVSPSRIDAGQWEWMKRYRLWEANRKVFLFPENWLEPELRDDKSPFFKELESQLLQSDITDESASVALLDYLAKLEEVAKLEPCGVHYAPADPSRGTGAVEHVVARSSGASRKYYYRRREFGVWTPWEHIKLDIEGGPVIPVVWRDGRLLLLWLRILKQTPLTLDELDTNAPTGDLATTSVKALKADAKQTGQSNTAIKVSAVLCWSEYLNGKWQAAKTSDISRPLPLATFPTLQSADEARITLSTEEESIARYLRVWITITGQSLTKTTSYLLYNTHSLPERETDVRVSTRVAYEDPRRISTADQSLTLAYYAGGRRWLPRRLLRSGLAATTAAPTHALSLFEAIRAPFYYADALHAFRVTTTTDVVLVSGPIDIVGLPTVDSADLALALRRAGEPGQMPALVDRPTALGTGVAVGRAVSRVIADGSHLDFRGRIIGPTGSSRPVVADTDQGGTL